MTMEQRPVADTWERGDPYERYVGRWSRRLAPRFLAWLHVPAGRRWLDVGCGTGALSAAILDHCAPSALTSIEPSEGFLEAARRRLAGRADLHRASATQIPLGDVAVDVVVSGLVLNFLPDQRAALAEMTRVTARGGTIGAYVWDYAVNLDEGLRFPVCRPEGLAQLFTAAGLEAVEVTAIDVPTPFTSFEDYWQPFLGGQGPAPAYAMSLDEAARSRLREHLRARLPAAADGSIPLTARAWAARGAVSA